MTVTVRIHKVYYVRVGTVIIPGDIGSTGRYPVELNPIYTDSAEIPDISVSIIAGIYKMANRGAGFQGVKFDTIIKSRHYKIFCVNGKYGIQV